MSEQQHSEQSDSERFDELAEAVCDAVDAMYADSYVAPSVELARRARAHLHATILKMQDLAEYQRRRPPKCGVDLIEEENSRS